MYPGINTFVQNQAARGHRLLFINYAVMDCHFIKPLFSKLDTERASAAEFGYSTRDWRRGLDEHGRVNLANLAGSIKEDKRSFGPSSIDGSKLMMNIQHCLDTRQLEIGLEAARALFDNRMLVFADPGSKNLAGMIFVIGCFDNAGRFHGVFKKSILSSQSMFSLNPLYYLTL